MRIHGKSFLSCDNKSCLLLGNPNQVCTKAKLATTMPFRCNSGMILLRPLVCVTILALSMGMVAAMDTGHIKYDVTVGSSNSPLHLKAGQEVQIMSMSGTKAVIMAPLPDGTTGVYQIDAAAVDTSSATPPPTSAPAAPVTPTNTVAAPTPPPAPAPVAPSPPAATPTSAETKTTVAANPDLPEDKITLVHVSWPETTKLPAPYTSTYSANSGSYSYKLYIPPGYYEHPDWKFPTLFIMSPNGNADLSNFKTRVHDEGWLVVMFVEAKNGPWEPIFGDMLATHADVIGKVRILDGAKFSTGFSGGARGSSILSQVCPGFDGELLQGAGFAFDDKTADPQVGGIPHDHSYAVFMAIGTSDSNFKEIDRMKNALSGTPFKFETFSGGHVASPTPQLDDGLDWLLQQSLSASDLSDDLRAFGSRHFDYVAGTLAAAPDSPEKTEKIKALIDLGDKLGFPDNTPQAAQLKKLKDAQDKPAE